MTVQTLDEMIREKSDAEVELTKLKRTRSEVISGINSCQATLTELRKKLERGKVPYKDMRLLDDQKTRAMAALRQFERKSRDISAEMDEWKYIINSLHKKIDAEHLKNVGLSKWPTGEPVNEREDSFSIRMAVERLQAKYAAFSEDQTRVSSMRLVAAQVANELADIIKAL